MNFSNILRGLSLTFLLCSSFGCFKRDASNAEPSAPAVEENLAVEEELPPGVKDVQVARVQQALNKNGAEIDVDGVIGQQTRAAIRKFQKANGLKVTGRIDDLTMEKLGFTASK